MFVDGATPEQIIDAIYAAWKIDLHIMVWPQYEIRPDMPADVYYGPVLLRIGIDAGGIEDVEHEYERVHKHEFRMCWTCEALENGIWPKQ